MVISWIYNSAHRNFLEKILCKRINQAVVGEGFGVKGNFLFEDVETGVVTCRRNDLVENKTEFEKRETY